MGDAEEDLFGMHEIVLIVGELALTGALGALEKIVEER